MDTEIVRSDLLQRCIKLLDCMKNEFRDGRPKTEVKLKNVLQKVSRVYYISSVLNVVFKYGKYEEITITEREGCRMSDEQIDLEIVKFALREGETCARKVLVLPCDSNLHNIVASNVEDWYTERKRATQSDNSVEGIVRASCLVHELDPEEVIRELKRHQYVSFEENPIKYNLPRIMIQRELEQAQRRFQAKFKTGLGKVSARGREIFTHEIIEANKNIQSNSLETIRRYCEEQYASKYSLYGEALSDNGLRGVTEQLKGASMGSNDPNSDIMDTDNEDDISSQSKFDLIPITITTEVTHVIMELLKAQRKPETCEEFEQFVLDKCGVIYITSPKYILSNIIKEDQHIPPNFTFNFIIGKQSKKTFKLGNSTELANMLTFPGKEKRKRGSSKGERQGTLEPMDTSSHDNRQDVFEAFQKHVYTLSKSKAERYRSVPVILDQNAELRCKDRFLKWIQETNSNQDKIVTKEAFRNELTELSFESSSVPSDYLEQLLIDAEYLDVKKANGSVVYKVFYKNVTVPSATIDTNRFLRYLARDYKPDDCTVGASDRSKDNSGECRKRSAIEPSTSDAKRQKVIDI